MIVELVGTTGTGKTTLLKSVRQRLGKRGSVTSSFDVVMERFPLPPPTHPTTRNVAQDLTSFPFLLLSLFRYWAFISFALKILASHSSYSWHTLNYLRSVLRKVGTHEILRRSERGKIILVDEGIVLAAHNLFVYTDSSYTSEDLGTFARLAPLPDLVVHIKAPLNTLVERSRERPDTPKELRRATPEVLQKYLCRSVNVFDELMKTHPIASRAVTVDNDGTIDSAAELVAEHVCEFGFQHPQVTTLR